MSYKTDEEKWPRPPVGCANHVFDIKENVSTLGSPLTLLVLGWPDSEWLLTTKSPRMTCTMRWLSSRQEPNFAPLMHFLFICIHSFKTKNYHSFEKNSGRCWWCIMELSKGEAWCVENVGCSQRFGRNRWSKQFEKGGLLPINWKLSPPLSLSYCSNSCTMEKHYVHASVQKWLKPIPPVFHHKCFCLRCFVYDLQKVYTTWEACAVTWGP